MEGICSLGFPVYDFGHAGVVYGDRHCGECFLSIHTSLLFAGQVG